MRIALITQDERLYLPPAVHRILSELSEQIVMGVILPSFNEDRSSNLARFYRLMGPADFLRLASRYAGAAGMDLLNRVWPLSRPFSAEEAFLRHRVPFQRCEDINAPAFLERVLAPLQLDLIVSIAASQRFKEPLLALPKHGCINLHSSPLPRHRGMMPNFWAMASGAAETCVTIHRMDPRLDAGELLLQRPVPIPPKDSLHQLMTRSKVVGAEALLEAIPQVAAGTLRGVPMDPSAGNYNPFPTRADAAQLRQLGHRFF